MISLKNMDKVKFPEPVKYTVWQTNGPFTSYAVVLRVYTENDKPCIGYLWFSIPADHPTYRSDYKSDFLQNKIYCGDWKDFTITMEPTE